jgi:hypothetical protein
MGGRTEPILGLGRCLGELRSLILHPPRVLRRCERDGCATGIAWPRAIAWTLVLAFMLPLAASMVFFLIPIGRASEQSTFASQWVYHFVSQPLAIAIAIPIALSSSISVP